MAGESEIVVTFPGGKRVDAVVGGHLVRTDQPTDNGGDDDAPTPAEQALEHMQRPVDPRGDSGRGDHLPVVGEALALANAHAQQRHPALGHILDHRQVAAPPPDNYTPCAAVC